MHVQLEAVVVWKRTNVDEYEWQHITQQPAGSAHQKKEEEEFLQMEWWNMRESNIAALENTRIFKGKKTSALK